MKKAIIIGSGFSGLSSAAFLAKNGVNVTVIEKNPTIGGRARIFKEKGYTFDMGPSWYWMSDIFDNFFKEFNYETSQLYQLIKLDPGFKIIFKDQEIDIPSKWDDLCKLFDKHEKDGSKKLIKFMKDAEEKYKIGIDFLYNSPGVSVLELFNKKIIKNIEKLQLLTSYRKHIKKSFQNPIIISLLEFPVLFLGAAAADTPALYSLMAYSGIKEGTFYPNGGFNKVIQAMIRICKEQGVNFLCNEEVTKINIKNKSVNSITTKNHESLETDILIASADYAHVEKELLKKEYRNYSDNYWKRKTFSPSSLIFYLGVNKSLEKLEHHNLFFDENIDNHTHEIYEQKCWPKKPLFYVCCPSKTDKTVAPDNKENLFILIPITAGITDTTEIRNKYFNIILERLEKHCKQAIKNHIEYKRSYCIKDFKDDYNSYKGNAYGLANTLSQTANLRPKIINRKVNNLYYTGQLTVPGPGVPPAIISGQIVSEYVLNKLHI